MPPKKDTQGEVKSWSRKKNTKVNESAERTENQKKLIGRVIMERAGFSLIDEYFDLQIEFEKKYGEKTIVLMQVGGFFEAYGVNNNIEKIGNLNYVSELLNIQLSRRNKSIIENSRTNALMMGFPLHSIKRFLNVLLNDQYTIVLIEQVTEPPNVVREITAIHSPGTYIEDIQTSDPNHIVSIYIDESKCHRTGASIYSLGLSAIDLTTGKCTVYQKTNHMKDKKAVFEDMYRFVESYNPKEVIYYQNNELEEERTLKKEDVITSLNMVNRLGHFDSVEVPNKIKTLVYQNEFLRRVYPDHGLLDPIDYLNLERSPQALMSFILLLNFAYEHNENILKKIQKPDLWEYQKHLILYHNTIYQLNIIPTPNSYLDNSTRFKSLYDILLKTSTSMGRRLLKYRLTNPITEVDELNKRYNKMENMMNHAWPIGPSARSQGLHGYELIESILNEMIDMERMHRKMELGVIHPHEFGSLHLTNERVIQLLEILESNDTFKNDYDMELGLSDKFREYMNDYMDKFDITEINKYGLLNIQGSFFKPNKSPELDQIQQQINTNMVFLENEAKRLSNLIENGSDFVKLENNERDGYYFSTTKKRGEVLERNLSEADKRVYELKKNQLSVVKISSLETDRRSSQIIVLKERLKGLAKEKYLEEIQRLIRNYDNILHNIVNLISEIDLVKSCVKVSIKNGYHKPLIEDRYDGSSYFESKKMRHPLIELINEKVIYIDNDIELLKGDEECTGILLMGLNGVGKSSMAKAIGCNIVMAQMGMYVAASDFKYYPYEKIFTRINGDDNIFKGMSSFVVEMNELRSILKYSDDRSMVLGDEVCKGTEETSALSIVSSSIQTFSERGVNFVMATHFHKLYDMEEIQSLNNVRFKHLSVEYDDTNKKIIYGRKLIDGPGDTLYGLEIAQYLIQDDDFIYKARRTRDKLLNQNTSMIETIIDKQSRYNSDLVMDKCTICGKNNMMTQLHTHHIKEQNEFDDNDNIDGIRKNQLGNLVILCEEHHEEVHHGNLRIDGWITTTKGRELNWCREI